MLNSKWMNKQIANDRIEEDLIYNLDIVTNVIMPLRQKNSFN